MQAFLTALIQRSVSMSALALVLLALSPLLARRCASKWLYGAWMVIVAGLVVPFRLPTRTVQIRAEAVPAAVRPIFSAGSGTVPAAVSAVAPAVSADPAVPWDRLAGALWIAGVAAFLLYHGLRHARFLGMVKRWSEPAQGKILKVLEASEREMGIAGRIGLRICPCVSSPMVTGFRNAVILLPRSDFSEEELKYILRHELVHFRRKDLWLRGLVVLAAAVHWFNPMVYLIAKAAALQCELSCDAAVVDGIGPEGRRKYGEVLLGAVKSRPKARTAFSSNFYSGKKGMKKRIFAILDTRKKKAGILVLCLILLGTLGTGTAVAVGGQGTGGRSASPTDSFSELRTLAGEWAEAVKNRDGKAQYALLSPKCQAAVYDEYSAGHWSTGTSSPWVESYEISVDRNRKNSAAVTYRYATSTGFAGDYEQTLSFAEQNGKFLIDGFSEPKEVSQTASDVSSDSQVGAFLSSADGRDFQGAANRFVKVYLIGDIREMKRCLSNPESGRNDFSMAGRTVDWKSLTLKIAPEAVGENAVSAEYEIFLPGGGSQSLCFTMEKTGGEWKTASYKAEK